MRDNRLQKLAKVLIQYSLNLKKDEVLLIQGPCLATPLIKEVYRESILAGAHPYIKAEIEGIREILLKEGSDEQLKFISEILRFEVNNIDAALSIIAHWNTKSIRRVAPEKIAIYELGRKEIFEIMLERIGKGEFKWCGTQFPNQSDAQEAEMSLEEYEDFVFRAGKIYYPDPVKEWKRIEQEQRKWTEFLNTKKEIQVKGEGVDLKFRIDGRKWINCCGKENFPDGEIFTSPVENSVQGYVTFSYPGFYRGKEANGISLEFKEGKVFSARAEKGEEFLKTMLNIDEGAKFIGEFGIGTNKDIKEFTRNTLFDEKIGGTIHIALGASLPESGGKNKSVIHWDIVTDLKRGEIYADGEIVYKNGDFLPLINTESTA